MEKTKGKFITVGLSSLLLLFSLTVSVTACEDPSPAPGWPPKNPAGGGDPVYLKNGEYHFSARDVLIWGRVMPVQIVRTYGSRESAKRGLGHGWDMNYNLGIVEQDDYTIILHDGEHRKLEYTRHPSGYKYTAPPGFYDYIEKTMFGTYVLHKKHGTKLHFTNFGKLYMIVDRNSNYIAFGYTNGLLTTIYDDVARMITLTYNSNDLLETITDSEGRTWTYGYDTNRNLCSITSPATEEHPSGLTTTYTYDEYHNLLEARDPANQLYLTNEYNANDWLTYQTYGTGSFTIDYNPGDNRATVTDREGYDTRIIYNSTGNPTHLTTYTDNLRPSDPLSYTTRYAYNSDMEITRKTFPKGNCIDYTYDPNGNVLGIYRKTNIFEPQNPSDPDVIGTTCTYEKKFNFVKTITDPRGNVTDCTYDGVGNLTKITFPAVSVYGQPEPVNPEVSFTYNTLGQLTTVTAPDGIVTKFEYHSSQLVRLKKVIRDFGTDPECLNMITGFTYDALGRVATVIDPGGNITEFTHNNLDQLKQIEAPSPFEYITKFSHNQNKKLSKIQAQLGPTFNPATAQTTEFTYEILDHLKRITNPLGHDFRVFYDNSENPWYTMDAESEYTTFAHDERNLLWKVQDAMSAVTEYSYDDNGNLRKIEDAKNQITTADYDDFDRLIKITYPDNTDEVFGYDKSSNVTSWKNRKDETITYQYDALNRRTRKTWPNSRVITYAYDIAGRLAVVSDSGGPGARYWCDRLSRVTSVSQGYGAPGSKTIGYQYDAMGRRQRLTYPDDSYITYHYDQLSRLTCIKDQGGSELARYTYDELSRREQVEYNQIEATADYDYVDKVEANNDNVGNMLENLTNNITGPAPKIFDYTYDDVGNRLTMKVNDADTHYYSYDSIYQLTTVDYPPVGDDATYNYDSLGNRTSVVNSGGVIGYWKMDDNAANTTVENSAGNNDGTASKNTSLFHTDTRKTGTGAFGFDGDGDCVNIGNDSSLKPSLPISVSMWVKPNNLGINHWLISNDGYTGSNYYGIWGYIRNTNQISISYGDGGSPGPTNRRSKVSTSTVSSEWQHIAFVIKGAVDMDIYINGTDAGGTYSGTGGALAYSTGDGTIGSRAGTALFMDAIADDVMIFDTALSQEEIKALHTEYSRNSLNQYTSVGGTNYDYDDNGNLININNGQYEYVYDYENRLTEAKNNSQTVGTYSYDFAGRRITKTADSTTTKYYYDGDQIIAEYEGSTLVRKFIYGPGIDEPIMMIDVEGGNAKYYYHYDALGSVVALSNSSGIVETYSYDVFGEPSNTGSVGNPYFFTGRRLDTETGLYYYRFRYYKPDIGRFLQPDPIGYYYSMNLYEYCGNDPLNWIDPWGLCKEQPAKLTPEEFYAEMAKLREIIRGRRWWQRWDPYSYITNDSDFWFGANNDRLYEFEGRLMRGNALNYYGIGMLYRRYWGFLGPVGRWGAIKDAYLWKIINMPGSHVWYWFGWNEVDDIYHLPTKNERYMLRRGYREYPKVDLLE